LPALTRSYPRHFTFYVAHPMRSIQLLAVSSHGLANNLLRRCFLI
jgi:hypothetical protein